MVAPLASVELVGLATSDPQHQLISLLQAPDDLASQLALQVDTSNAFADILAALVVGCVLADAEQEEESQHRRRPKHGVAPVL